VSVHRRLCFETAADGSTNRLDRFTYDNYLCVARNRWSPAGTIATDRFVWDPTEPVATRPLVWQTNNCDYFYSHDGNKNVSEVVDAEGSLAAHYEYSSFGAVIAQHGELAESNPWRFSSEFADDVLGLMYYNYRHYEPVTGRWLLSDPIDQGEGEYCFCMNNPASVCDRCGLYTLGDASGSLSQRGVLPLGKKIMNISITPGIGIPVEVPFYTQEQIFSEWLRMEQSLGNWWQSLPRCPRCICIVGGVPINPDPSIWKSPEPIGANAANHPGGVYEMRSQEFGHSANQCIYDQEGKVMLNMPTAGTVDYYAFPDNGIKHFFHDLEPFWYARDLGRIGDYYAVRPSW
jgi:RHS repeat-associated protein